jgi:FdhD protein
MSSDLPSAIQQLPATVITPEASSDRMDAIAAEVPVALVFNGISHAVMMCSPQNLEAFALGFALSEGHIDQPADCYGIEVQPLAACGSDPEAPGISVEMQIASRCFARLKEKRRALTGRTGCGICGIDSMDALDLVPQPLPPLADWASGLGLAALQTAFAQLPAMQLLNQQAGAIHAAGWASADGQLQVVLEDVGRHNALDKLLGHMAQQQMLGQAGFVVMTSRASYELVRKCARMGLPVLATISAPTSLAIQVANQAGMRLFGLCRGARVLRYSSH